MTGVLARHRERPAGLLTRHFFRALFDFGVFTQEGADAFVRVVIGLVALLISAGLLIVYVYAHKYVGLSLEPSGEPYVQAFHADVAMALGLPMWIVALVTVLISHSLFPDETDWRVLLPLPVGRGLIFATKLSALALFTGLFTLTATIAVLPLALRISSGRWALDPLGLAVAGFGLSSIAGCVFAALAVVGVNGALITWLPRGRVHAVTAATRAAMIGALVLVLPFLIRMPGWEDAIGQRETVTFWVPPIWFMGLERVVLGHRDAYVLALAGVAAGALIAVAASAAASYLAVYRRFDRALLHAFDVSRRARRRRAGAHPARAAVQDFASATLRRSVLHQGVIVGLSAVGVALAAASVARGGGGLAAASWAPFPIMIFAGVAARASFALPIEPKANWVFRTTESDAIRPEQLRAAAHVVGLLAVGMPVALTLPVQWIAAGPFAMFAGAATAAFGWAWTELVLRGWRRIPFTCTYLPGKHSVAQSALVAIAGFTLVTSFGGALEYQLLRGRVSVASAIVVAALAAAALGLRRSRRALWREVPLRFDDELPGDVQPFPLSSP